MAGLHDMMGGVLPTRGTMHSSTTLASLAGTIQLSLAPVFLFMGIAAFLSMLSLRLGRVIDRGRLLDSRIPLTQEPAAHAALCDEAALIWRRIFYINWSIRCSVFSALLICLVVICLFLSKLLQTPMEAVVSVLFILAMLFLVLSLLFLLREVGVSTDKLRQGLEHVVSGQRPAP